MSVSFMVFFVSFFRVVFSSMVSCGIPFQVFMYAPVICMVSSFCRLKSCQAVNCAFPVSSARIPEKNLQHSVQKHPIKLASRNLLGS